jgi:hypothetical protein
MRATESSAARQKRMREVVVSTGEWKRGYEEECGRGDGEFLFSVKGLGI